MSSKREEISNKFQNYHGLGIIQKIASSAQKIISQRKGNGEVEEKQNDKPMSENEDRNSEHSQW